MEIKEGEFFKGMASGYQRQLTAYNGHCRLGFYQLDEPYGKYVEYDREGNQWQKEGIYVRYGECIKQCPIDSFEENTLPESVMTKIEQGDLLPVNYHLNRKGSRLMGPGNQSNASFISDVSNLTAKEQEIEKEKQEL